MRCRKDNSVPPIDTDTTDTVGSKSYAFVYMYHNRRELSILLREERICTISAKTGTLILGELASKFNRKTRKNGCGLIWT